VAIVDVECVKNEDGAELIADALLPGNPLLTWFRNEIVPFLASYIVIQNIWSMLDSLTLRLDLPDFFLLNYFSWELYLS